jgi:hypothetical protein
LVVVPLLDGFELLVLLEPELPLDEEPDLLELGEPEAPIAPVLPELEPPDWAAEPELPDEPLAESEPPLPQAVSETAAAATKASTAVRERVDACMRNLLELMRVGTVPRDRGHPPAC